MEYVPDPKHLPEWERIKSICDQEYEKTGNPIYRYRSRCISGLITGKTLDYSADTLN